MATGRFYKRLAPDRTGGDDEACVHAARVSEDVAAMLDIEEDIRKECSCVKDITNAVTYRFLVQVVCVLSLSCSYSLN